MKISGGLEENGVVVGNAYDKYGSQNPIVRWMMKGFSDSLSELVVKAKPLTIHEVGCGEGFWVLKWQQLGIAARGSDFSIQAIELAQANASEQGINKDLFEVRSIYDLAPGNDSADLVVCCEVLEHLEHPEEGLRALQRITTKNIILSVPREPIWRVLNMARGKYMADYGNTPGHLQHWSKRGFVALVSNYFMIEEIKTPLPWTMLLCRKRD